MDDKDIVRNYFRQSWKIRATRIKLTTNLITKIDQDIETILEKELEEYREAKRQFYSLEERLAVQQISIFKFQFQIVEDLAKEMWHVHDEDSIFQAIITLKKLEKVLLWGIHGDDTITAYRNLDDFLDEGINPPYFEDI